MYKIKDTMDKFYLFQQGKLKDAEWEILGMVNKKSLEYRIFKVWLEG